MDTVVVIIEGPPRDSDVVTALRRAGLRVLCHRSDGDVEDVALDRPDVVVIDVPDERRVGPMVEPVLGEPTLKEVATIAVVGAAGLEEVSRVRGLKDFVLRPLREDELVARVRRPMARRGRDAADRVRVGDLLVDIRAFEATLAGDPIDLTYQEFELLKFLVSHPGQAFTRDQLLARVWGYDYYGGSRTVDIHVRRIRAKLGAPYAGCVKTIRHVGYKWSLDDDVRSTEGRGA
jgi:DNA-binding response OmpR family regulator